MNYRPVPKVRPHWEASEVAAAWWTKQLAEPTFEKLDQFTNALITGVDEQLHSSWIVELLCDYSPVGILRDVAGTIGVPLAAFPWKTHMRVYRQYIHVFEAGRSTLLWSAPDWQRPLCEKQRYIGVDDEAEPTNEVCGRLLHHDGACGDWQPDPRRCTCGGQYTDHFRGPGATPGPCQEWDTAMLNQ